MMFRNLIFFSLLSISTAAQNYELVLKGQWHNPELRYIGPKSRSGQIYNDLWGWTSPKGKEYVILGSIDSTYFFDISDPSKPKLCDVEAGADSFCVHRDYKTNGHYCYAVADEGASTLQIFDLSYLPDSVHKAYDSNKETRRSHNIFIADDLAFLATNTHVKYARIPMTIMDISNPTEPKSIHHLKAPKIRDQYLFNHVHDVYYRDGIAYCSNGDDGLFIYDYRNGFQNPELIYWLNDYPDKGYNHSSWLNDRGNLLVFADETHGKKLKLYDVSNLSRPKFLSTFHSNADKGSIAHNPFIVGNLCFVSYYHDGLRIFDLSDSTNVQEVAGYDTYPENDDTTYSGSDGCWGVYPFFKSGIIAASDMQHGLFLFELKGWNQKNAFADEIGNVEILSGNKFITLDFDTVYSGQIDISISNLKGQIIYQESRHVFGKQSRIEFNQPTGIYFAQIQTRKLALSRKFLIVND